VGHFHGVVKLVAPLQGSRGGELLVRYAAQVPALLEPGEVPNLPQWRVDDAELRSDHLLIREVAYQLQSAVPAVNQHGGEPAGSFPCVLHEIPPSPPALLLTADVNVIARSVWRNAKTCIKVIV
jgi:hypothetical protein